MVELVIWGDMEGKGSKGRGGRKQRIGEAAVGQTQKSWQRGWRKIIQKARRNGGVAGKWGQMEM